jgi:hypothetical protein
MEMIPGEYDERGPHFALASKRQWHPFDPKADEFEWSDVGSGLSRVCRFNGQLPPGGVCTDEDIYSVAQHCVHAGDLLLSEQPHAPVWLRLAVHIHDGEEALSGFNDPVGPVKRAPQFEPILRPYLNKIQDAVALKAGLRGGDLRSPQVKVYDKLVYAWENRDIRGNEPPDYYVRRLPVKKIRPWRSEVAFAWWMSRLQELLSINSRSYNGKA